MYFDLLLLFLIFMFALFGYIRGFVSQVISLLAILSIVFFAQPLANWLKEGSHWNWFENAPRFVLWGISAYFIILFYLAVSGIVYLIRRGSEISKVDRWIGCAVGAAKGVVFAFGVSLAVFILPDHAKVKFKELHADTNDSVFMKMAQPMLNWNFNSTFQSLHEISAYLKVPEKRNTTTNDPWAQGTHPESE